MTSMLQAHVSLHLQLFHRIRGVGIFSDASNGWDKCAKQNQTGSCTYIEPMVIENYHDHVVEIRHVGVKLNTLTCAR